jgi:class 3 adenylate cyclase
MLNAYFGELIPLAHGEGAEVVLIGDAVMAIFNARGDAPDHAQCAARTALGFQDRAAGVVGRHPDWPRLRIGVNSGEARVGILGAAGARTYTATGDTVNVASRLESQARPGEVVIGAETRNQLDAAETEEIGELRLKGVERPVSAYVLRGLAARGPLGEGEEGEGQQDDEGGG